MSSRNGKTGTGFIPPVPVPSKAQLDESGIRICIGIPMERTVTDVAFIAFWEIAQRGWPLIKRHYGRKDANRHKLAQTLLDSDFTHLLMMDLDHLHYPDIVEKHARWVLHDPSIEVVAGVHHRRGAPFDPCVFVEGSDGKLHAPVPPWDDGLYKVAATGFGSVLISRSVFERLPTPWFANDYSLVDEDSWPGEDMWFSHRCKEHGIDIWADTTITSPHLIYNLIDRATFEAWLEDNQDKVRIE